MSQELTVYSDPARPIEDRVNDLLSHMTLDEKLAQLGSLWVYELFEQDRFSERKAQERLAHGIGQITRIGGASNAIPPESAALANEIQHFVVHHTRLGIPVMVHEECCSGYMARGATLFPQAIGAASTWDAEIVEAMGDVIRTQVRAVGGHQALAPVLDVARDPRWGRVEETFGEDPYLISSLGSAYIRGIQGPDLTEGIVATAKHFVGYGLSEGGRNWAPAYIPQRELLEVFIRPFEAAIKMAGLASIMNAYHELDGIPCGASRALLTELLREKLGFDGILVSDYFSVDILASYHYVAENKKAAAIAALEAGIDLELPSTDCYGAPLRQALDEGRVDIGLVDTAVSRILRMKFRLGLFENPYVDTEHVIEVFETPDQRALARQIARESIVLLKNEGQLLPLKKDLGSIAVIGPNAHTIRNLMGDYSYPAHIETLMDGMALFDTPKPDMVTAVERPVEMLTILDAIRRIVSPQTQVHYAQGCDVLSDSKAGFAEAMALARQSDLIIMVMGDKCGLLDDCTCGEARDRAELGLPGVQEELVQAVYETGKPIILVLVNGRPLTIPWFAEHIPAILEAWMPGEEGANAITEVLFGDYNPGGKLPITFPRAVGQIPLFYNHKPSGGRSHWREDYVSTSVKPQFPFGHGLSYTCFEFSNLQINAAQVKPGGTVTISVEVANVGDRAGDEVVQLYIRDIHASITRPVKELKGYKRLTLEPGQSQTVIFYLDVNQLAFYDRKMRLVVEPGIIEVMIGSSSEDIRCTGSFEIVGETTEVNLVYFSHVEVRD